MNRHTAAALVLSIALAAHAGLLLGYVAYEFVHLSSHAGRRWGPLRALDRYHMRHHFENANRTFGVTTPLWDWVFGTLPRQRSRAASAPTCTGTSPTSTHPDPAADSPRGTFQ
ncbi:MAG: sterol desaturase family protein, partial [Phycisphaerae bacterium]|nr:sterol desaturase family protein [Phycisphaerae bacterium]